MDGLTVSGWERITGVWITGGMGLSSYVGKQVMIKVDDYTPQVVTLVQTRYDEDHHGTAVTVDPYVVIPAFPRAYRFAVTDMDGAKIG
jgi:hypothetical protein